MRQVSITSTRSGPLPTPADMELFERILPGAAVKLFDYADRQQAHRHELERIVVVEGAAQRTRGQWFSFLLVSMALIGGTVLVALGKELSGLVALVTAIGAAATGTIWNRIEAKRTREGEEQRRLDLERQQQLPGIE